MRALIVAAFACGCGRIAFDVQGAPGDGAIHDVAQQLDGPAATKLVFTSGVMVLGAGDCSQATTVEAQSATGQPVAVPVATPITLSSSSSAAAFFLSSSCTGPGDASIAAGTSSATFYWADTKKGSPVLEARASGYAAGTQVETIQPLAPTQIGFETTAVTVAASTCSPARILVTRDQYGNGSNVAAMTVVALSSSSGTMGLFGDAACNVTPITSVTMPAGTNNSPMFYFIDPTTGSPVITASSLPLTAAMQTETVN